MGLMRNRIVRGLLAGALVAGLIAAGCGDDDDDANRVATSEFGKEEWVAQANEICADLDRDTDAKAEEFFSDEDATEERFASEVVSPGLERWADELAALGAPDGDEETVHRMTEIADEVAGQFRTEDPAEITGAEGSETRRLFDEGKQLATQLGIEAPCGDGSEADDSAQAPELTKEEWLAKANAACEDADKVMNREGRKLFAEGEPSQRVMEEYALEVVVPAFRRTIEDIRALGAPEGDEAVVEELLAAQEEGTDRVEQDPLSIFEEDEPSEADRLAAEYGLTSCGDTD